MADWLSAGECYLERGCFRHDCFQNGLTVNSPQLLFIRSMNEQSAVHACHEYSSSVSFGLSCPACSIA